jgi:hypothetical protein
MEKARIRGELFQQVMDYIHKKWGSDGLEMLGMEIDHFKPDAWYDLDEFCELMDSLYTTLGISDPKEPFRIGKWMVTSNPRWVAVFKGKDPGDVFTGSKNQELEYVVGEFKGIHSKGNEISIHSTIWTTNNRHLELWSEFYRGRMQGVLDLTGRRGMVTKVADMLEKEATCTYGITWT